MTDKNIFLEIGIGIAAIIIANWLIQRPQTPQSPKSPAGYGFMSLSIGYDGFDYTRI